jgi:nucleoside-diphosphate-sugar epimerase
MRLLVTGGTGFLGSEFIRLACRRHKIFAIFRNEPGVAMKGVEWIKLDLVNRPDFDSAYERLKGRVDAVVHIGGATPNRAYKDGTFDATTKGTRYLLELSNRLKARRFIFISSISVLVPKPGPYAGSKLIAEMMVKDSGISYTILRPSSIIGRGARDFMRVAEMVGNNRFFPIIGSGKASQQPVASEDLVKIILECLQGGKASDKTYPVVGPDVIPLDVFLKKIAQIRGNRLVLVPVPAWLAVFFARIAERINPLWGLNEERVRLQSYPLRIDPRAMDAFHLKLQHFDGMIGFLRE